MIIRHLNFGAIRAEPVVYPGGVVRNPSTINTLKWTNG